MAVMENVVRVGKTYKVRKRIPVECREAFGVTGEFKTVSLDTADKREAQKRAVPILADIDARIAAIRNQSAPPRTDERLSPARVETLIREWRHREIKRARDDIYNGDHDTRDASETSHLRYALQHHTTIDKIADFNDRMAAVLGVTPLHPVIARQDERERFRMAWHDVETYTARFATDVHCWDEDEDTPTMIPTTTPTASVSVRAGMKLSQLRDAWDKVKPLDARQKGYIRRLIEYLGDIDIAAVTPTQLDDFKLALEQFPKTKKPSDDLIPFNDLIAAHQGTNKPRLNARTVWGWTMTYKGMFAFAVQRRMLTHNPAAVMMKRPSPETANDRDAYLDEHLDRIFTRPMFTGFAGPVKTGNRAKPGSQVVKDSKYWLPIVALHTGMRLEEMASLRTDEIIDQDGILAFDLTKRPLTGPTRVKNAQSRRIIPLHKRLTDLGFVAWLRKQNGYVFPDLTTDPKGKRGSEFSKWWGRWCKANAEEAGQGIDDPALTFHSFRHSFKTAASKSPVKEEIHDRLTGHIGGNAIARKYGDNLDLATLKANMDLIEIGWP